MESHWSDEYVKFISIKIEYEDGSAQWWDYDASQYETLDDYKLDIATDFAEIDEKYQELEIEVAADKEEYLFDIDRGNTSGADFAELVINYAEAMIDGN